MIYYATPITEWERLGLELQEMIGYNIVEGEVEKERELLNETN